RDRLIQLGGRGTGELADDVARVRRVDVGGALGGVERAAVDEIRIRGGHCGIESLGRSIDARSQSTSTIAEKSLAPCPCARAALYASRATVAMVTGTRSALAASTINERSLCARSIVNPGSVSPLRTFVAQASLSWPFVAVVPWITSRVFSSDRP